MVRGRRVRTVVSCQKSENCCSPGRKKRGNGLEIAQTILSPKSTITRFFHTVNNDFDCQDQLQIKVGDTAPKAIIEDIKGTDYKTLFSPPTPHRIELRLETEVIKADRSAICFSPKLEAPPPKARRRLNNNSRVKSEAKDNSTTNHKLTEYFPVRRSVRKTEKTVLEEKQRSLEQILRSGVEEGLKVKVFEGKGRGVVASRPFERGDFVVEYSGDLIDPLEAKRRELNYAQDQNAGCYMYYFKHGNQNYCIDATAETGRLGRLVNHSRNGNLVTRTVMVDCKPRLILVAKESIDEDSEVTYDYGDRSKESLKHHPWLAY